MNFAIVIKDRFSMLSQHSISVLDNIIIVEPTCFYYIKNRKTGITNKEFPISVLQDEISTLV